VHLQFSEVPYSLEGASPSYRTPKERFLRGKNAHLASPDEQNRVPRPRSVTKTTVKNTVLPQVRGFSQYLTWYFLQKVLPLILYPTYYRRTRHCYLEN